MRSATTAYTRPLDIRHGHVDLGHGAGGRSMNQLIADLFVRAFDNPALARGDDGAVLPAPAEGERDRRHIHRRQVVPMGTESVINSPHPQPFPHWGKGV